MRTPRRLATSLTILLGSSAIASAQPDPKFEFGKADDLKDVDKVDWNATAEAGLVLSTGNSRTTTVSGGLKAMRKEKQNKLSIEAAGVLARASNLVVADTNMSGTISSDEITRERATAAKNLAGKVRYDRFLSEFDALFVAGLAAVDPIAGKDFTGGGQLGYARTIFKSEKHAVVGEAGYDFSYENYVSGPVDSVSIHSARGFAGYEGVLTETTKLTGSIELFVNVNETALADRFEDIRTIGKAELSTKITDDISLSVSFLARFDNVPAPAALGSQPQDLVNPPTKDQLASEKLDTTTKASLIVTLL